MFLFVLSHGDVVVRREPEELVVDLVLLVELPDLWLCEHGEVVLLHLWQGALGLHGSAEEVVAVAGVAHHLQEDLERKWYSVVGEVLW